MTPDTIMKAAETLAREVHNRSDARAVGAELGRTLAAQIKTREVANERLNSARPWIWEMTLLRLAAGSDDAVADSGLQAMRERKK